MLMTCRLVLDIYLWLVLLPSESIADTMQDEPRPMVRCKTMLITDEEFKPVAVIIVVVIHFKRRGHTTLGPDGQVACKWMVLLQLALLLFSFCAI